MKIYRSILTGVACAALLCLPALGARRHAHAAHARPAKAFSAQDFINSAAQADMLQANIGQMATSHSRMQALRELAVQITDQKTDDYRKVTMIANKLGLQVPKAIDSEGNRIVSKVDKLKYQPFNAEFVKQQLRLAEEEVKLYEDASKQATNPELKKFVDTQLVDLKLHFAETKDFIKYHSKGA